VLSAYPSGTNTIRPSKCQTIILAYGQLPWALISALAQVMNAKPNTGLYLQLANAGSRP
jgi:LSD1 subclass zinc finger protein